MNNRSIGIWELCDLLNEVKRGNLEYVRNFDGNIGNLDLPFGGTTLLMEAAKRGSDEMCKILIDKRANINTTNESGKSALHFAAIFGHVLFCERLINVGAVIDMKDKEGFTPLYLAAEYGNVLVCKRLIKRGANVNTTDKNGITPLYMAAKNRRLDMCELLIENGADTSICLITERTGNYKCGDKNILRQTCQTVRVSNGYTIPNLKQGNQEK